MNALFVIKPACTNQWPVDEIHGKLEKMQVQSELVNKQLHT